MSHKERLAACVAVSLLTIISVVNSQGLCSSTPPSCPLIKCPYGYEYDSNGCQLCQCHPNPCDNHTCPEGELCYPQTVVCVRAPCYPIPECRARTTRLPLTGSTASVVKPGSCPAVCNDTVGICIDGCRSDGDCPRRQKCCSNGCGRTCQPPVCDRLAKCQAGYVFDRVKCRCVNPCKNVVCRKGQVCVSQLVTEGSCEPRAVGTCETRVPDCPTRPPCNIRCRWGLKYDKKGCQLCECYDDPCKDTTCSDGKVCKAVAIQCFVPPCIPPFEPSCVSP